MLYHVAHGSLPRFLHVLLPQWLIRISLVSTLLLPIMLSWAFPLTLPHSAIGQSACLVTITVTYIHRVYRRIIPQQWCSSMKCITSIHLSFSGKEPLIPPEGHHSSDTCWPDILFSNVLYGDWDVSGLLNQDWWNERLLVAKSRGSRGWNSWASWVCWEELRSVGQEWPCKAEKRLKELLPVNLSWLPAWSLVALLTFSHRSRSLAEQAMTRNKISNANPLVQQQERWCW